VVRAKGAKGTVRGRLLPSYLFVFLVQKSRIYVDNKKINSRMIGLGVANGGGN
jgi:hypothetical protein